MSVHGRSDNDFFNMLGYCPKFVIAGAPSGLPIKLRVYPRVNAPGGDAESLAVHYSRGEEPLEDAFGTTGAAWKDG
jgi:hypothetical protein